MNIDYGLEGMRKLERDMNTDVKSGPPQPKFKFGDKVSHTKGRHESVFNIRKIEFIEINQGGSGEFKYNGGFWESELELYQEPKKKKLYAFSDTSGWVSFAEDTDRPIPGSWHRSPEYDIEYPESLK